jgi:hypothetical protein
VTVVAVVTEVKAAVAVVIEADVVVATAVDAAEVASEAKTSSRSIKNTEFKTARLFEPFFCEIAQKQGDTLKTRNFAEWVEFKGLT